MSDLVVPRERPMEPFDALMFRAEDDPRNRPTILGAFVLAEAPDWDRLVESYERITRLVVPLRQRVVSPPVAVAMPHWVVDPDFDLSYHLRRTRLPAPGSQQQLLDLLAQMMMAPLDRSRPLWEFTLVEGLEDGSAVFVTKANHAVADGVGGQALARLTFDLEPDPDRPEMPPRPVPVDRTPNELLRKAVRGAPFNALGIGARAARTALHLAGQPGRTAGDAAAYAQSLRRVIAGPAAEPSPLLRGRSSSRQLLVLDVDLVALKAASRAGGGSLNDGFLAAVAGGVRRYHEHFGVPVDAIPIAVPINLRRDDDPSGGNRWAGARLALPIGETDPAQRIERMRAQMLAARAEPAINPMSVLAPVAARLPTWLLATAAGSAGTALDLQVSNIPGSPVPLYLAGVQVTKTFGFGPVPGPAAMLTLYSYLQACNVGVTLDPAAITDAALFQRCLAEGFDEVLALG